jgi:hypothetical protein
MPRSGGTFGAGMMRKVKQLWMAGSCVVLLLGTICFVNGANDPFFALAVANEDSGGQSVVLLAPVLLMGMLFVSLRQGIEPLSFAIGLGLQSVGLVLGFAGLYSAYGLLGAPAPVDRATSLYFSVVTWTTLGYGDLQPAENMHLIAAFEALLGYVYLGLLVGAVVVQVISNSVRDDK